MRSPPERGASGAQSAGSGAKSARSHQSGCAHCQVRPRAGGAWGSYLGRNLLALALFHYIVRGGGKSQGVPIGPLLLALYCYYNLLLSGEVTGGFGVFGRVGGMYCSVIYNYSRHTPMGTDTYATGK